MTCAKDTLLGVQPHVAHLEQGVTVSEHIAQRVCDVRHHLGVAGVAFVIVWHGL